MLDCLDYLALPSASRYFEQVFDRLSPLFIKLSPVFYLILSPKVKPKHPKFKINTLNAALLPSKAGSKVQP